MKIKSNCSLPSVSSHGGLRFTKKHFGICSLSKHELFLWTRGVRHTDTSAHAHLSLVGRGLSWPSLSLQITAVLSTPPLTFVLPLFSLLFPGSIFLFIFLLMLYYLCPLSQFISSLFGKKNQVTVKGKQLAVDLFISFCPSSLPTVLALDHRANLPSTSQL